MRHQDTVTASFAISRCTTGHSRQPIRYRCRAASMPMPHASLVNPSMFQGPSPRHGMPNIEASSKQTWACHVTVKTTANIEASEASEASDRQTQSVATPPLRLIGQPKRRPLDWPVLARRNVRTLGTAASLCENPRPKILSITPSARPDSMSLPRSNNVPRRWWREGARAARHDTWARYSQAMQ